MQALGLRFLYRKTHSSLALHLVIINRCPCENSDHKIELGVLRNDRHGDMAWTTKILTAAPDVTLPEPTSADIEEWNGGIEHWNDKWPIIENYTINFYA